MKNMKQEVHQSLGCGADSSGDMNKQGNDSEKKDKTGNYGAEGMCWGMCLGMALGISFGDNTSIGLTIGMLIGLLIGSCIKKEDGDKEDDEK